MSAPTLENFKSPIWLPNGHFQTIYPSLFRKRGEMIFEKERILSPDDDFLDLFWSKSTPRKSDARNPLVVLSHGLEGSVESQYIVGMVKHLNNHGFDCLAWNFRGCGEELNRKARFYHSGATEDLDLVVQQAIFKGYDQISLMGFSLGGNLTLKYLGERGSKVSKNIRNAVTFSTPMDLEACSLALSEFRNRLYMNRFLKSLSIKIHQKGALFADQIDLTKYSKVKTLYDFDDIYTAPLHGFENATHYYSTCSSQHFIGNIGIKTLIVNAKNDPFVPFNSIPVSAIIKNDFLILESPREGGHCGFRPAILKNNVYWSEARALLFLTEGI